jgi:tripartite-type tricarboxylate transporter receptor subunit TctC
VQMSFQNLGSIAPHVQEGRVKPILITSDERSPLLPRVPTAAEAGLRDFVVYSWQAMGAPAGLPAPLLRQVHERVVAALRAPETERRMAEIGFEAVGSTPEEFAAFQRAEIERWRKVIETGGIKPE